MAAESAAQSGSGVAGMVCSLRVLLLVSSVLALEGKREGAPENPHLLLQTQHRWGNGKDSEKAGKDRGHRGEKEWGGFQRKAPQSAVLLLVKYRDQGGGLFLFLGMIWGLAVGGALASACPFLSLGRGIAGHQRRDV